MLTFVFSSTVCFEYKTTTNIGQLTPLFHRVLKEKFRIFLKCSKILLKAKAYTSLKVTLHYSLEY